MRFEETDVVIAGGGVAGFAMAVEVFRRGLRARVLRRDLDGLLAPRLGAIYQPRALACFTQLETYEPLRSAGAVIDRLHFHRHGVAEAAVTLDYAEAGPPFPHALGVGHADFQAACLDAFAKYSAIQVDQGVELMSLFRERGRVAGAVAQGPDGEVTYRAKVVVVTTNLGGAHVRAEAGAPTRSRPYHEESASCLLERPEGWEGEVRCWLGPGLSVCAYPVSPDRLRFEAIAPAGTLAGATARGADALRGLIAPVAPRLEGALKRLDPASVHVAPCARSQVKTWVADAVALIGPGAHAMSPAGMSVESQAVLDAAVLAGVLSRCLFTGDFSGHALKGYEVVRRPQVELVAALSHDLHRLGMARSGLLARARESALDRLGRSPALGHKLVRALAGFADDPLTRGERLRLAGWLPLSA